MKEKLLKLLNLKAKDQDEIAEAIGPFKTVSEFMCDIVEATKDSDFIASITSSTPWWLQAVGESIAEAAPIIKFIYKLIGKLGEIHDPDKLAYLAFTLAYQRSMEKAFIYVGPPSQLKSDNWVPKKDIPLPSEGFSFGTYSLKDPFNHDFIKQADSIIKDAAKAIGYNENGIRVILGEIHMRFPYTLKNILTHPQTKDKFSSLAVALNFDNTEERVISAWRDHFEYQRYLFEDKPIFGEEKFTLNDIYVDIECGIIDCGELHKSNKSSLTKPAQSKDNDDDLPNDPFEEKCGGRVSLIDSVISLIGDKNFRDAIIIQGPAGSGKSAFTLRLAVELLRQGLYPIRIRFRDLALQFLNIEDVLPEAVRFWDIEERPGELPKARPDELFLGFSLFDQSIDFGNAKICPWVLILDGWDEVSIAAQKGFALRINEILSQVYDRIILRGNRPPVRVILTGRPSEAVLSGSFVKRQTKLLTIRPLNPTILRSYIGSLAYHLTLHQKPIKIDRFLPIIESYEENFKQPNKKYAIDENDAKMEIFGLPLLTHLAVRLIVNWPEDDIQRVIENPTNLYRLLTDLTCGKGGRYGKDVYETKIIGKDIRKLLHETAIAMTVYGKDSIPYDELDIRLSQLNEELIERVQVVTKDHPVTSLMINFFFKGGQKQLGAEFLHKSFREFLYAEAIVETLKEYGKQAQRNLPNREGDLYWKDFEPSDIRWEFSRRLGKLLCSQWISKEVSKFLEGLIAWEFSRTYGIEEDSPLENTTEKLEIVEWEKVRDGLADLWGWWGEGVHLRPQPILQGKKIMSWNRSIVEDLVLWSMNQNEEKGIIPIATRTVAMDSHLGNGLFILNVLVHHYYAKDAFKNKLSEEEIIRLKDNSLREYQSAFKLRNENIQVRFRPTGHNNTYFLNYIHRINAAGWHPGTIFPSSMSIQSVDFNKTSLILTGFASCNLTGSSFVGANLIGSIFMNSDLSGVNFTKASLRLVDFVRSNIKSAKFDKGFIEKYRERGISNREIHIGDEELN